MDATTIQIAGMSCSHCVAAVKKALATVAGVAVQDVAIGSATVIIDPSVTTQAVVEAAIDAAGYDVVRGRALPIMSSHGGTAGPSA
jgi:copper chaperone CopZ